MARLDSSGTTSTAAFGGTTGTILTQNFSARAGDRLAIDWNFLTSEGTHADFARARILSFPGGSEVATVFAIEAVSASLVSGSPAFTHQSGWRRRRGRRPLDGHVHAGGRRR